MAFQAPKMAPKTAPKVRGMPSFAPTIALPQSDKPNFEEAAVIPEGIVNTITYAPSCHQTHTKAVRENTQTQCDTHTQNPYQPHTQTTTSPYKKHTTANTILCQTLSKYQWLPAISFALSPCTCELNSRLCAASWNLSYLTRPCSQLIPTITSKTLSLEVALLTLAPSTHRK